MRGARETITGAAGVRGFSSLPMLPTARLTELEAELYALTHRGNPGDTEFYARRCAGAGSVLELGTGYGRLLPALPREELDGHEPPRVISPLPGFEAKVQE